MDSSDNIKNGRDATKWIERIGEYGDPIRMAIINPMIYRICELLNTSTSNTQSATIANALQFGLDFANNIHNEDNGYEWNKNIENTSNITKKLDGLSVWDLGCGEGYLSRLLGKVGAECLGVDASEELIKCAQKKQANSETFINATLQDFLNNPKNITSKPHIIILNSVLDAISDPEILMTQLAQLLRDQELWDTIIYISTFDPDYFYPSEITKKNKYNSAQLKNSDDEIHCKDHGDWERLFLRCNFHVLEHRPLHISLLPKSISDYIYELNEDEISRKQGFFHHPHPRQGPFTFWLLKPRFYTKSENITKNTLTHSEYGEFLHFKKTTIIETAGTIGSFMYEIIDGHVEHVAEDGTPFSFKNKQLFGHMEITDNIIASRFTAPIIAKKDTTVYRTPLTKLKEILPTREQDEKVNFSTDLFYNILHHFDSSRFYDNHSFSTGVTESSKNLNEHLQSETRAIAKIILHFLANKNQKNETSLLSTVVEISYEDFSSIVPKRSKDNRNYFERIIEILKTLRKYNIIDAYSPFEIHPDDNKIIAEDTFNSANQNYEIDNEIFHLGFYSIKIIFNHCFSKNEIAKASPNDPMKSIQNEKLNLVKYALLISKLMKNKTSAAFISQDTEYKNIFKMNNGTKSLQKNFSTQNLVEYMENDLFQKYSLEISSANKTKIINFLEEIIVELNYNPTLAFKPYRREFSKYFLVRDLWALYAIYLNNPSIWSISKSNNLHATNKKRVTSYYSIVLRYIATKHGLNA